jgi:gas vesicle protein
MDNKTLAGFSIGLLTGAVIGGVVALLLAPQSGKETRRQIRETTGDVIDTARDRAAGMVDTVKDRTTDMVDTVKGKATGVVHALKS